MSRRDRPSRRDRVRKPARPSRGRARAPGGGDKGVFHHWKLPLADGSMHDVHISESIPFEAHQMVLLDLVGDLHLPYPQKFDPQTGFYRSELNLREFGRLILSTDPKHNETWVWRE